MGNCWPYPVHHRTTSTIKSRLSEETLKNSKSNDEQSPQKSVLSAGGGAPAHPPAPEVPPTGKITTPNLKVFTYADLRRATKNFRLDTVLGEGGFGSVFRGYVDPETYEPWRVGPGIAVAIKKSNSDGPRGLQEWQAAVQLFGKFSHPNLVKLLGYCCEERQFLLVYEYMQRGSLEDHLFRRGAESLQWDTRMKIAVGAARGLAFLHTTEKSVIYRDFKPSNILLDADFNAKLSDSGLAKLGPVNLDSHVTTRVIGTYGYVATEYLATGHLYVKSDVFSFGVVLLEMLTGLRAIDTNRPSRQHNLVDWARPILPDSKRLKKYMDPRLENQYPSKAAFQVAELILKCLESDPKNRPSMEEVLAALEEISTMKMSSKELKTSAKHTHRRQLSSPLHRNYAGNRAGAGAGAGAGGRAR